MKPQLSFGIPLFALLVSMSFDSSSIALADFVERNALAQSKLSASLMRHLQASSPDIMVISPAGAAAAVALIGLAANEQFREVARSTLGYDATGDADLDLEQVLKSIEGPTRNEFSFANATVIDERLEPNKSVITRMRQSGAEVWIDQLSEPRTIRSINQWVLQKTRGLVPQLIDDSIASSGLVVLNALYFKDDWATGFEKSRTQLSAFHNADGTVTETSMMHGRIAASVRFDGRIAAVRIPYRSSRFSLTLVTTTDVPSRFSEFPSIEQWLSEASYRPAQIEVVLPRVTLRATTSLMSSLSSSGLGIALAEAQTFRPLSTAPVHLDEFLQKVFLKLDEQGSEAAAATAVYGRSVTPAQIDRDFISFDNPFLFALQDQSTGMLLLTGFVGRIPSGD